MVDEMSAPRAALPHAHYMGLSGTALRIAIGMTAGLCFICFGYGQGDIGSLMVMPTFQKYFPQIAGLSLQTCRIDGITIGIWNLGSFVGAMIMVVIGDRLGRKRAIIAGLCIMIVGKIIQVSTFSFGQLLAGRFIAGFGNGWIASTVPAWQAECLKTHRRGTLLMVSFGSCITAGLALAYWIGYAFSWTEPGTASWRGPIGIGIIPMVLALMLAVWMPESPRYLILTGREQEAKNVLSALNEVSPEDENIHREFLMIKNTILFMTSASIKDAFRQGKNRHLHRIILAVVLQTMAQFTGVNLFMQYLGSMFMNQLHYPPKLALLLAAACATEFFLASLVAVVGIDRFWGRRTLTIFGASGMCVCMIVLAGMAYLNTHKAHLAMTAFLFMYNTFFSIGWQGMSWLWAVELIPLSIRGPSNALSTAANWLSNFIVVLVTPILFTTTMYRTYIVFAVTNFCIVPIVFFFYPETGSRSLEEVDLLFSHASQGGKRNPWFGVVKTAQQEPLWYDKNGDPSTEDTYTNNYDDVTEKGRTNSSSEKSKADLMRHSDSDRWAKYTRERSSSGGTAPGSESTKDAATTFEDSAAIPPPNIDSAGRGLYGVNRTGPLTPSDDGAASPPPAISRTRA
ncbi:hypothetical protein LTR78_008040 [Recurvomyces mirabilis]|uniref:Major facilitator superfamily (MFS) profile domain-containing protein n=1 Tax=Recurvomyces mirabilis TaxID=574656 RepID=A0AAE0TU70_9PEZI|nr:hypothetical protein LTR78_008040 [Recurvomyces mirabilis]KAK5150768.1 hypothetical protein LTS14_009831 [Recurvomyces mirabilis]